MNTLKCWAVVLIAVLLLPNSAATADPAKEAYEKGNSCLEKKDYDAAIAAFTDVIRLTPKDAKVYCTRGYVYSWKNEYDKAIADYTEAIKIDPKTAGAYYNRGWTYGQKRDYDKAVADYSEAIRLDSKDATAYYARGYAFWQKGNKAKADADFAEAKKLGYKEEPDPSSSSEAAETAGKWTQPNAWLAGASPPASLPFGPGDKVPTYQGKGVAEWVVLAKSRDSAMRATAATALEKLWSVSVPTIAELLKDKDWRVRRSAAETLGRIGFQATIAYPDLQQLTKDRDRAVRWCRTHSPREVWFGAMPFALRDPPGRTRPGATRRCFKPAQHVS